MKSWSMATIAALCTVWGGISAAQPSFDEFIADLDANAPQAESLKFDFTAKTGAGTTMTGTVVGKGSLSNAVFKSESVTGTSDIRVVAVEDGTQWVNMVTNNQPITMKIDPKVYEGLDPEIRAKSMMDTQQGASQFISDPRNSWRRMGAVFDLQITGEEGENYVLEGAPKGGAPVSVPAGQFDKVVFHVNKNDGYPRHALFQQVGGAAFLTVDITNLEFGASPEEGAFTFTPAEGAMVMDLTPMIQQQLNSMQAPPATNQP